jgi:putative transposase
MLHRSSHSVWDCRYHLVFSTKRRRRALKPGEQQEYCEKLLRRAAAHYDMNVLAIEVDLDHVHIYLEIPPQLSVGKAVRVLKSLSARYMFKKFPQLKRAFWSGEMWSPSYFVRAVGQGVTAEMVKRYIEAHADKTAETESVQAELFPGAKRKG